MNSFAAFCEFCEFSYAHIIILRDICARNQCKISVPPKFKAYALCTIYLTFEGGISTILVTHMSLFLLDAFFKLIYFNCLIFTFVGLRNFIIFEKMSGINQSDQRNLNRDVYLS